MIDTEKRRLAKALLDLSNQRFVLLSESRIPLFDFKIIYNYIINSRSSFLGSFDEPRKLGRGRYNPKMWPVINITHWRKDSQWFKLHSEYLAVHVVSDIKYYVVFKEYCRPRVTWTGIMFQHAYEIRERTDLGAEVGRACCELIPKDDALTKGLGGASGLIPEERLIWMKGGATGGWSGRRDVSTTIKGGLGGATGGWSGRKGTVDDDWAVSRLTVAVVGGLRR
ncbi:hypothetical protein JRO89_XS11G0008300 [Xanthoceras sorbifolium]|uniref:Uncharacterized protein n=1 Tax=Xanthoceras sorbifolium TaxID=99658 RepID=A0ABQ8HEA7_9ROSI|nr:hypothetical protein JRO89_XS11G0008300 [Xanthoceras sorbifolium]